MKKDNLDRVLPFTLFALFALTFIPHTLAVVSNAELTALESLYNSTNGWQWFNNDGWLQGDPCDNNWYGVICSMDSVTELDLSRNNLVGTISNIEALTNLRELYLDENQLTGTIPNFNLPNLGEMFLSDNQLTGTIPNFNLPYLQDLYLSDNQLTGTIPNFNSLDPAYLDLSGNQLTGTIPNFNFQNLWCLYLSENQLTGTIPNFNSIACLYLSGNQLTGTIPNFNFQNFWALYLSENQLTGTIPNFNSDLVYLYLSGNQLTGTIPNFNSLDLAHLFLSGNQLTGTIPNFNLPYLEYLFLSGNQLTGTIPNFNLQSLEVLNLSENQLYGSIPNLYFPNLQNLNLQGNYLSGLINPSLLENFGLADYNLTNNNFTCPVPLECLIEDRCDCTVNNVASLLTALNRATLLFVNGSDNLALQILEGVCNITDEKDIFAINGLQNISCQWANNIRNGYNFFGARDNSITKLSWQYYDKLLNYEVQNILIPYENLVSSFQENIHNQQQWMSLTNQVISHATSESQYWSSVATNASILADTEANLILEFRSQLNHIISEMNDDFTAVLQDIQQEIIQVQNNINNIESSTFLDTMLDIGETLVGSVLCICGLPAESLVVSSTANLIGDFFDTLSAAQKVTSLENAIEELQGLSVDLENARLSLDSVAEFYTSISLGSSLPEILPELYLNDIVFASMDTSLNQFANQLLQWNDLQILREQVNQLVAISKQYSQAIINWYLLELKIQSYEAQANIASSSIDSLNSVLQHEQNQEYSFIASYITAWQFQVGATFRILVDMLYVQRQYNYYSLSDFSFARYLPFNPNSANIIYAQTQLQETIIEYLNHAATPTQVTANYTLTVEHNNSTFQQLWNSGVAYFVINLPKPTPSMISNHEFYYSVNVLNIQVYPSPIINPKFSTINVLLTQLGDNTFYDSNARLWNFTTNSYAFNYVFQESTKCSISSPYVGADVDYIHYSPYGIWKIEIPTHQLSIQEVDTIEIYFTLYLTHTTAEHIPLWGFYPYGDVLIPPLKC